MNSCSQCGAVNRPTDKFCNTCGMRLAPVAPPADAAPPHAPQAPPPAVAPQAYAPPPQQPPYSPAPPQAHAPPPQQPPYSPPPQGYGQGPQPSPGIAGPPQAPQHGGYAPPPPYAPPAPPQATPQAPGGAVSRCQQGHEIPKGANYCGFGHPLALDNMAFAGTDGYPQAQQGYAPPPQPPHPGVPGGSPFGSGGYAAQQPPPQAPAAYAPSGAYSPAAIPPAPVAQRPQSHAPAASPAAAASGDKVLRGFLVSYQTNPKGEFWPLTGGTTTLGRAGSGEALAIAIADPTISSRHASLHVDGSTGSVVVEDHGSTNGTYVNEDHLGFNGKRDLRDGDRVRFGGYTAQVKIIARL
ncbi:MAG: FHA domain-containing protein [Polyangiaceae bacterium]